MDNTENPNINLPVDEEFSLERILATVIKTPGVRVDRNKFLSETFSKIPESIPQIIKEGPVEAGVSQEDLNKIANSVILSETSKSSLMSFMTGIPGGFAMAATIPADVIQFYGVTLRLVQKIAYLYGIKDLWEDGELDDENVKNQFILYCGVMFGVSSAENGVRVLASNFAKIASKKIPQKALTKGFWYPLLKNICKSIGIKVTKDSLAKNVAKVIPVIGGVVSGGLNFISMKPMGERLQHVFEQANFGYTEETLNADIEALSNIEIDTSDDKVDRKENIIAGFKNKIFKSKDNKNSPSESDDEIFEKIDKIAKLHDSGVLTDEEFSEKKKELLSRI